MVSCDLFLSFIDFDSTRKYFIHWVLPFLCDSCPQIWIGFNFCNYSKLYLKTLAIDWINSKRMKIEFSFGNKTNLLNNEWNWIFTGIFFFNLFRKIKVSFVNLLGSNEDTESKEIVPYLFSLFNLHAFKTHIYIPIEYI